MDQNSSSLKGIILISGLLIAGGLGYLGYNVSNSCSAVQNLCSSDNLSTGDTSGTDEEFNARVETAIEAYIEKQAAQAQKEQEDANKPQKVEGVEIGDNAILGDPDAPVTIIEFSDFECPYCKRNFEQVLPLIKENYIDTGKVKYVFRDFPLYFHDPLATKESLAAECARAQGGDAVYYEFHDALYETTTSNGNGLTEDQIYDIADTLGLNKSELKSCVENETYLDNIQADMAAGEEYGVQGTPNYFINGWQLKGAYPYESFVDLIDQELAAAGK